MGARSSPLRRASARDVGSQIPRRICLRAMTPDAPNAPQCPGFEKTHFGVIDINSRLFKAYTRLAGAELHRVGLGSARDSLALRGFMRSVSFR